jgi:hypothetical protein
MSCLFSCKKLLHVPIPSDQISPAAVFSTDADANSAMYGLYIEMMNNPLSIFNGGMSFLPSLSADDITCTYPVPDLEPFCLNSVLSINPNDSLIYSTAYNLIYTSNSIVNGVAGSGSVSINEKTQLTGEALFNRALVNFYLVNLYGPVPLVTSTDFHVTGLQPRASIENIYSQIIKDLLDAEDQISPSYLTAPGYQGDRTRPNNAAASAMLARVYLFTENWPAAENEATKVINNPLYTLENSLDSVFLSKSHEAIWQLQPVYQKNATAEGSLFLPITNNQPAYVLTPQLLLSFETGDLRYSHWTNTVLVNGTNFTYPFKYKQTSYSPLNPEYETVIRLAELYLIRAEARAEQGNIVGAAYDLNTVRGRAGLPGTAAADQAGLLTAIIQERRVELFTEWGHRWLDLKRTNQVDIILGTEKQEWQNTDTLYPIPYSEMLNNPNLTQNPGYN